MANNILNLGGEKMRKVTVCLVLLSISTMAFGGLQGYKDAADFTNTLRWVNGVGWTECQYDWLVEGWYTDNPAVLADNVGRGSVSSYDYAGIYNEGGILKYDGIGYYGNSGIWPTAYTGGFSPAVGATVEYGGFALQGTTAGSGVHFSFGPAYMWLKANTLTCAAGTFTVADISQPHNYRFAILGDNGAGKLTMNVYQDDTLVAANMVIGDTPVGSFYWENWTATEWETSDQFTWQLDYIRYDTNGGWTAIPEPATMAILGLGGLFAIRRRK
jgi:hypothetical protein